MLIVAPKNQNEVALKATSSFYDQHYIFRRENVPVKPFPAPALLLWRLPLLPFRRVSPLLYPENVILQTE
jgi:hypothetical protein